MVIIGGGGGGSSGLESLAKSLSSKEKSLVSSLSSSVECRESGLITVEEDSSVSLLSTVKGGGMVELMLGSVRLSMVGMRRMF